MQNQNNNEHNATIINGVFENNTALHFKKILDSSIDVICTIDKCGVFKEISVASFHLWGYKPEELFCKPALELVLEEDKEKTIQAGKDIAAGSLVTNFENRYIKKDGSIIPMVWSAKWDKDEEVMYCIARDGREKILVEQKLKEEQTRLIRSQQMAKIGSWEYDLIGEHTYWASDELFHIYGLNRYEIPEMTVDIFMKLVHPDDKEMLEQDYSDINRLHNYYREHRMIRPDGQMIYVKQTMDVVYENGVPVRLTGVVQDISDQKASEQLMLASERRFRTLVQNGFDMISILDTEGNYTYISDSVTRILGHNPSDLLSTNTFDHIHPDDIVRAAKSLAKLHSTAYVEDVEPIRFKNIKGEWRWLETIGTNMLQDPVIKGFVYNARDITEKKLLQESIEKEAQIWQKKLTSAAITAQEQERTQLGRELHDNVNQMLTTVKLYTELCIESVGDTKTLLEKSASYISICINEIRSISKRLSTPIIEDLNLAESINDLVSSLNLTDKINIHLDLKNVPKKLNHEIHLGIYRIIQEQLTNILKHAEAKNVNIIVRFAAKNLLLSIQDDGKGFELNAKRKGIGISNMYARANSINGDLHIKTSIGKGCLVELKVPVQVK
jgi:PAS domain S-box-containing protein